MADHSTGSRSTYNESEQETLDLAEAPSVFNWSCENSAKVAGNQHGNRASAIRNKKTQSLIE